MELDNANLLPKDYEIKLLKGFERGTFIVHWCLHENTAFYSNRKWAQQTVWLNWLFINNIVMGQTIILLFLSEQVAKNVRNGLARKAQL